MVLTHAHGEIPGGLEPIEADAKVASFCVNTVPMAADIWDFLTFIAAWKTNIETNSLDKQQAATQKAPYGGVELWEVLPWCHWTQPS